MSILDQYISNYPNRTMCAVLDEMRACIKTLNFAPIPGLIEEVQIMGNRMEAALEDKKDLRDIREQIKEGTKELKQIKEQIKENK